LSQTDFNWNPRDMAMLDGLPRCRGALKLSLIAIMLLFAAPAQAAKCYHHEDHEDWTLTVNDPGVSPEFVLKQDGKITGYQTGSGGTGVGRRYAVDEDENVLPYRYVGDVLLLDYDAYYPGCK
jgi:hypothetical protein